MVIDDLRSSILNNRLVGGERLRQDAIATQYGVSQMIVREAFKQLTSEGFLKAEPRRGVSVAVLSADEAWEVTQLRALLECQALRWAIHDMLHTDFLQCAQVLEDLERASSVDAKILLNARFHTLLYRSEEHTSELQSLMRISYAVFCLKKKIHHKHTPNKNN